MLLELVTTAHGEPAMVAAAADLDGDGWPELILTGGDSGAYIDDTKVIGSNQGRYDHSEWYTVSRDCEE